MKLSRIVLCLVKQAGRAVNLFLQTWTFSLIWNVWFAGYGLQDVVYSEGSASLEKSFALIKSGRNKLTNHNRLFHLYIRRFIYCNMVRPIQKLGVCPSNKILLECFSPSSSEIFLQSSCLNLRFIQE